MAYSSDHVSEYKPLEDMERRSYIMNQPGKLWYVPPNLEL